MESLFKRPRPDTLSHVSHSRNLGKEIQLIANHFQVQVPKSMLFHYDVEMRIQSSQKDKKAIYLMEKKFRKLWAQINFRLLAKLVIQQSEPGGLFYCSQTGRAIQPAFDGVRNMYTCRPLYGLGESKTSKVEQEVAISFQEKPTIFRVTIKFATRVDLESIARFLNGESETVPMDVMRALEIVLRHCSMAQGVPIGKSVFERTHITQEFLQSFARDDLQEIGAGKYALFGHYQTLRLARHSLNLVLDRSTAAFYIADDLLHYVGILLKRRFENQHGDCDLRPQEFLRLIDLVNPAHYREVQASIDWLRKELVGLQVQTTHLPYIRKFKITDLSNRGANDLFFEFEPPPGQGGRKRRLDVATYFRERYQIDLQATLPCLNVGSLKKPVYLPLQVCALQPNQQAKRLSYEEHMNVIEMASEQPIEKRFELIERNIQNVKNVSQNLLSEFDLSIDTSPIELTGVQLYNPKLKYKNVPQFQPSNGSWGVGSKKLYETRPLLYRKWCVVNFAWKVNQQIIRQFMRLLVEAGNKIGIRIEEPIYINEESFRGEAADLDSLDEVFITCQDLVKSKPDLIFCVIPNRTKGDAIYRNLKREAEVAQGLITQCCTDKSIDTILSYSFASEEAKKEIKSRQNGDAMLANILLKINAKMGGINCVMAENLNPINELGEKLLILGADVTHPAPQEQFPYSVCSVVSSCDPFHTQYLTVNRIQARGTEEMIKDMRSIMYELTFCVLQKRIQRSNRRNSRLADFLPENILYYRDGVSEGQYDQLLKFELESMKLAFNDVGKKLGVLFKPKVSIIVVLKRHNTRFKTVDLQYDDLNDWEDRQGLTDLNIITREKNDPSEHRVDHNPPPGTLVESQAVLHSNHEFFLSSHNCSHGTVKPTHYYLLLNECNFSMASLQQYSYGLCYLFAKCTKSTSIPAPVKYAHLGAYRARQYLKQTSDDAFERHSADTPYRPSSSSPVFRESSNFSNEIKSSFSTPTFSARHSGPSTSRGFSGRGRGRGTRYGSLKSFSKYDEPQEVTEEEQKLIKVKGDLSLGFYYI